MRELAVYGFDSDNQTLVGLGPVERARRSRATSEVPDSQRMPQSEAPGPFIADDDDESPPTWRRRKLHPWPLALSAVLAVGVAVSVLVSAVGRGETAPRKLAGALASLELPSGQAAEPSEPTALQAAPSGEGTADAPDEELVASSAEAPAADSRSSETPAAALSTPGQLAGLPVKLPELAPSIDRSGGVDTSVGTINVTSSPPANIVLDGRPLGKAPRVIRVPAGIHTVVFVHPLHGRRSLTVNVSPGVTTGASAVF